MIESMTGYGKGAYTGSRKKITVDIKSINSKQLDLIVRVPPLFREQENTLRNALSPLLERGKVDVTVTVENMAEESALEINAALLKEYKSRIEQVASELQVNPPSDWIPVLFRLPEALTNKVTEAGEEENKGLLEACLEAARNLHESRLQEGRKLYHFFLEKTGAIRNLLAQVGKYEAGRVAKIKERLELQLQKLESIEYEKGRLEQELIFYIEKLDVTEEKVRLESHLNYFDETLGGNDSENTGGKGKKLGFIAQEMGREINTLGSKSNDADMQRLVVMMKDELEQIKEQVLNVL